MRSQSSNALRAAGLSGTVRCLLPLPWRTSTNNSYRRKSTKDSAKLKFQFRI
jgi:hypothetical protein